MPGLLNHNPAKVIQRLLIQMSLGEAPPGRNWPVYYSVEPDAPDNVITTKGTTGTDFGRTMPDGERQEMHGFQVRIRASSEEVAFPKVNAIAIAFDKNVYQAMVTIDGSSYLVHSITRVGEPINFGRDIPVSKRTLYSINALVTLRMVQ